MPPEKCAYEGCKIIVSEKAAQTTRKTLLKPYCEHHAQQVIAETADQADTPELKIRRLLESRGFEEQKMKKGLWLKNDKFVDLNKKSLVDLMPEIGVLSGTERLTEDHGIIELDDIKRDIEGILRAGQKNGAGKGSNKDKKETPAPAPKEEQKETKKEQEPALKSEEIPTRNLTEELKTPTIVHKPDARISIKVSSPQGNYIKGLVPAMKEIGKIKIGTKGDKTTRSGHRLPVKFDHFEIVNVLRDKEGNLIPDPIMKELGENPRELDIFLLYNDETLNFSTRYNEYKGGRCMCSGDGLKGRLNTGDEIDCNPDTCQSFKDKKCKPNGILSVILTKSPRLGGVYKFRTTSYNSIRSILSSLFFIKSLTGGVLAMIPLKLTVSPMTVQPANSMTSQTIYVVNVEFAGTVQELLEKTVEVSKYQSLMRANIKQLEATARVALNAPESEEEGKDVQAEFYPEQEATK